MTAHTDDEGVGGEASARRDHHGVSIREPRPALEHELDSGVVEPLRLTLDGAHPVHPLLNARDGGRPVKRMLLDFNPVRLGGADLPHHPRRLRENAGRNAARIHAGSAGAVALDDGHFRTQLGRPERGRCASRARPNHDDVEMVGHRASQCSGCRLGAWGVLCPRLIGATK